jgi:hypothetical protein
MALLDYCHIVSVGCEGAVVEDGLAGFAPLLPLLLRSLHGCRTVSINSCPFDNIRFCISGRELDRAQILSMYGRRLTVDNGRHGCASVRLIADRGG